MSHIRKPRTWTEATRDPRVKDFSDERSSGDGLWLYLHRPWWCHDTDTSSVHEWSVAEVLDSLDRCEECPDRWEPDEEPETWQSHPSLTAEERNPSMR